MWWARGATCLCREQCNIVHNNSIKYFSFIRVFVLYKLCVCSLNVHMNLVRVNLSVSLSLSLCVCILYFVPKVVRQIRSNAGAWSYRWRYMSVCVYVCCVCAQCASIYTFACVCSASITLPCRCLCVWVLLVCFFGHSEENHQEEHWCVQCPQRVKKHTSRAYGHSHQPPARLLAWQQPILNWLFFYVCQNDWMNASIEVN